MEPKLLGSRLLVTLDEGKNNIGRIAQHTCHMSPLLLKSNNGNDPEPCEPGEEVVPEYEYYDHVVFVKEMSDEVEIDGTSYVGMSTDAIIAVIPD